MSMLVQLGIRKTFCMVDGCVGKRFLAFTFQEQKLRSSINRDPQSPLQTIEVIYEEKLKREE